MKEDLFVELALMFPFFCTLYVMLLHNPNNVEAGMVYVLLLIVVGSITIIAALPFDSRFRKKLVNW